MLQIGVAAYFISWAFLAGFIMMNIVLAILVDSFTEAQASLKCEQAILLQHESWSLLLSSVLFTVSRSILGCLEEKRVAFTIVSLGVIPPCMSAYCLSNPAPSKTGIIKLVRIPSFVVLYLRLLSLSFRALTCDRRRRKAAKCCSVILEIL